LSKPFDATPKARFAKNPRAWLKFLLSREMGGVELVDADLSTITSQADQLAQVNETEPWMAHVEFQSGRSMRLPLRIQRYNILAHYKHSLPVRSILVLLRPQADGPALTGHLQHRLPDGSVNHEFWYNVVRIWEQPVETIMSGSLATLPLAPITRVSTAELPGLIQRMEERLERGASPDEAADCWAATYVLMGLVYPPALTDDLIRGVRGMKESSTYQAILNEGRAEGRAEGIAQGKEEGWAEGAKRILLRQGRKRFGPPRRGIVSNINAIRDATKIEELADRILVVSSWDELIGKQ
jgi:predicted transposase YdaD